MIKEKTYTALAFAITESSCYAAIIRDDKITAIQQNLQGSGTTQSGLLVPMIQSILNLPEKIDYVLTTRGPGSFTAVRLCLATAQGLTISTQAKVFTPTSLALWSYAGLQSLKEARPVLVLIDSKRGDFYAQYFNTSSQQPVEILTVEQVTHALQENPSLYLTGDLAPEIIPDSWQSQWLFFQGNLAAALLNYFKPCQQEGLDPDTQKLKPFYYNVPAYRTRYQNHPA
jgi:tRNA threonylcarbamoyl adenosine modification protein YeaZ